MTPLTYLKDHTIDPHLCLPHHPAIVAGHRWLSHITPQVVTLWIEMLSMRDLLIDARVMLFGTGLRSDKRTDLVRDASDLSLLMPDLLCDPELVSHPTPESLDTVPKILKHCEGLISRPAGNAVGNRRVSDIRSVLEPLGTSLPAHARAMHRLRGAAPAIFAAAIADQAWAAIADASCIADKLRRDDVIRTIIRQWLLNRALHLQRGFAYVGASRRSAVPEPLRGKFISADVTAAAAGAYVDRLATGTLRHLGGYARALARGGKAGKPGCTSKPVDFVTALMLPERKDGSSGDLELRANWALARNYPAFMSKVPTIVVMKSQCIDRQQRVKSSLHRAAGYPAPEVRRLTLFEIWHHGLNPAAMLLMLATRFAEAAAITRLILETPEKAIWGAVSDFALWPTRAEVEDITHEMAGAIIPYSTPSFSNTDKNYGLAFVIIRRHAAGSAVPDCRKGERMMFECLDPLCNALPPRLRGLPGNLWVRPPYAKRPGPRGRAGDAAVIT